MATLFLSCLAPSIQGSGVVTKSLLHLPSRLASLSSSLPYVSFPGPLFVRARPSLPVFPRPSFSFFKDELAVPVLFLFFFFFFLSKIELAT